MLLNNDSAVDACFAMQLQVSNQSVFYSADDDSNLMGSEIQFRRKAVNVIEDSDSDAGSPVKKASSLDHADKVHISFASCVYG